MHCICPACGFNAPLLSFTSEAAAHRFAELTLRVPPALGNVLQLYLHLFAPAKHRMTFEKACRVLEPLLVVIETGNVRYAKRDWSVSHAQLAEALGYMVGRRAELELPLRNHNYLAKVLSSAANKLEAATEAQQIQQKREPPAPTPVAPTADEQKVIARRKAVEELGAELAAAKRLRLEVTRDQLADHLFAAGHTKADIEFALDKVLP
ncbi:hypothetical protein ED208_12600 [Stagnimonas aquatica]|uniref:DUF2752 domain-containing protein n=1 Tax=Stagnimonas aquatica TaxID=2689987 RepID=A0A3N0V7S2_9GAMM|nr:hypothetical protein [Stagnimonas aquatica]ROH88652.1 hypothetical protein ED208_12600 [Stagnimonas aquatica]